ncbi:hypothetical protein GCM10007108_15800 [Thermogymnomonas acidicola]|uniref:Uncharacterized protein n=1 Tax=Thermogymnomonas acidicola TaxID=399579 RepID=A0AA37BSG7_9ARCH|nr:hypothetical protein [Thermogymnomonas acidicola]GGM78464.1 hypothetical protein GCM10007108_15800 [Thermogymnomonas acidicola]
MVSLGASVRWYLKGLFPPPVYVPVVSLAVLAQAYALAYLKDAGEFSVPSQMLLIPFVVLIVGSQLSRNMLTTVFEISLLRSWRRTALSKLVALCTGLIPFTVAEAILLIATKNTPLFVPVGASIMVCASFSILALLSGSQLTAFVVSMFLVLFVPIAAVVLIENYASLGISSGVPMGMVLYSLAPLASLQYHRVGAVSVGPLAGLLTAFALAVVMLAAYFFAFQRQEFKP